MARLYLYAAILSSSYINLQLFQGCYARSLCSLAHQKCKLIHLLHFISTRLMSLVLLTCPYSVRSSYRVKALSGARVLLVELLVPSSTIRHPYMRMPELLGRKLTGWTMPCGLLTQPMTLGDWSRSKRSHLAIIATVSMPATQGQARLFTPAAGPWPSTVQIMVLWNSNPPTQTHHSGPSRQRWMVSRVPIFLRC